MRQVSQVSPERLRSEAPGLYDIALKMAKEAYGPLAILPEQIAVEMERGMIVSVALPEERQAKRYPPTDLEEATRHLQPCGYPYGQCRCGG